MNVEWHPAKAERNVVKHGVSFEEAATIFNDPLADVVPDLVHSIEENRFICLGTSEQDRLLVTVFTEEGETIRIISARQATPKEKRHYETLDPSA